MKKRVAILTVIAPLVLLGACGSNQNMKTAVSTEETTKETKKRNEKRNSKKTI